MSIKIRTVTQSVAGSPKNNANFFLAEGDDIFTANAASSEAYNSQNPQNSRPLRNSLDPANSGQAIIMSGGDIAPDWANDLGAAAAAAATGVFLYMFNQNQQIQPQFSSPNNLGEDRKRPKNRGPPPYTKGTLAFELAQQCDSAHPYAVCGRDPFHSDKSIVVKGKSVPSYDRVQESCKSLSYFANHCEPQSSVLFSRKKKRDLCEIKPQTLTYVSRSIRR